MLELDEIYYYILAGEAGALADCTLAAFYENVCAVLPSFLLTDKRVIFSPHQHVQFLSGYRTGICTALLASSHAGSSLRDDVLDAEFLLFVFLYQLTSGDVHARAAGQHSWCWFHRGLWAFSPHLLSRCPLSQLQAKRRDWENAAGV